MATLHIYGVGGHGREMLLPAREERDRQRLLSSPLFTDIGFVDDGDVASEVLGHPVRRPDEIRPSDYFVIAIGDSRVRQRLHEACVGRQAQPYSLFATSAKFGDGVEIGAGALFSDFTMVTASVKIGIQFQCNIYGSVSHDCVIGDYVTFAPKVCCNGNVHIGDFAFVGAGAVIKHGTPEQPLVIGKGAVVGMGAVVTRDVPPGAVVVGNPARIRE